MKVNKIMINGIIQNLKDYFDLSYLYSTDCGANIFKTEKHICPTCKKNEWLHCPDLTASFVSCYSPECLKYDCTFSKKIANDKWQDKMGFNKVLPQKEMK